MKKFTLPIFSCFLLTFIFFLSSLNGMSLGINFSIENKFQPPNSGISVQSCIVVHETSMNQADGKLFPTLIGGTPPFNFYWYNSFGIQIGNSQLVENLSYGWYGLKVVDATNQTFNKAFLVGLRCEQVIIDYNPGPDYMNDTYISTYSGQQSSNFGSSVDFVSKGNYTSSPQNWKTTEALLDFNLWVDPNISLPVANLYLFGKSHTTNSVEVWVRRITSTWDENTVTSLLSPSYTSPFSSILGFNSSAENKTLNITSYWNIWKLNNNQNFGLYFTLENFQTLPSSNLYNSAWFHSSDNLDPLKRPKILFTVNLTSPSVCFPQDINQVSHAEMKDELDGGVIRTVDNKVKFTVDYDYNPETTSFLPFEIYDEDYNLIASSDEMGNVTGGVSPLMLIHDDNRYIMDLSGMGLNSGQTIVLSTNFKKGIQKKLKILISNN
jgi:hypothetical protein